MRRRRKCERAGHDWRLVLHLLLGTENELLGVNCDRCGAYYGYRSPFNDHPGARRLGGLAK